MTAEEDGARHREDVKFENAPHDQFAAESSFQGNRGETEPTMAAGAKCSNNNINGGVFSSNSLILPLQHLLRQPTCFVTMRQNTAPLEGMLRHQAPFEGKT